MADFSATIVTPQGKIFEDKIESLSAPGTEGYLGILAHHAPLVTMLGKGILKVVKSGTEHFWAISSGVVEVNKKGEVLLLADTALAGNSFAEAKTRVQEFK